MVTSSSYSSLPYSPAVAFLSNFVEATAPRMAPDEEGEQVGDFIMGKVIGHGGFSVVREAFAIHMDGMVARVAVKVVKKSQPGAADNDRVQRMLDKEVAIWSRLSHPNVLPFVAVEKLPTSTFVFCELCTGGQLLDYLTKNSTTTSSGRTGLDECQAREIFNQIAEAVRYLHEEKRIVHRDIKLENVLQHEDGTWKICDFGLAEYQNDEAALYFGSPLSPTIYNPQDDEVGGSLAYCSPEQLRSQKPLRCPSSDVWSLGVVLYALLTGRLPFQDEYEPRLQYQILNGRYEDPTECSAEARELLKNMFRAKPEDRWKIGQVMDSPWCTGTVQETTGFANTGMGGFFSSFRA
ncbi:MAG: kinase-like domain-containing protein [Podila humilis]|nr:MAG: kinase-like domain-containing protein [Podila humilis]